MDTEAYKLPSLNEIFKNKRKRKTYDSEEFLEFVKDKEERYELINGEIIMMAAPSMDHQDIAGYIYSELRNYLKGKPCKPFIAPFDVYLFEKNKNKCKNVYQPDVFVVCDKDKMSQRGIKGAPDFVVEVVSPSNSEYDYYYKCILYMNFGVKEYWIIDSVTKSILVYINGDFVSTYRYTFNDKIKVGIFEDLEIDFSELQI